MKQWKDLKSLIIKNKEGNQKKKIENLVVFVIILIITIIAINSIWNGQSKKSTTKEENNTYSKQLANNESSNSNLEENQLEKRLENILSKIDGVGKVNVMLTYSQSSEIVPVYNESSKDSSTEETDSSGGTRSIKQVDINKEIVFQNENSQNTLITKTIVNPKIEGVIVTAQGANNANIKTNIIQAVGAVTGVATYKIQVFEFNEEDIK